MKTNIIQVIYGRIEKRFAYTSSGIKKTLTLQVIFNHDFLLNIYYRTNEYLPS